MTPTTVAAIKSRHLHVRLTRTGAKCKKVSGLEKPANAVLRRGRQLAVGGMKSGTGRPALALAAEHSSAESEVSAANRMCFLKTLVLASSILSAWLPETSAPKGTGTTEIASATPSASLKSAPPSSKLWIDAPANAVASAGAGALGGLSGTV